MKVQKKDLDQRERKNSSHDLTSCIKLFFPPPLSYFWPTNLGDSDPQAAVWTTALTETFQ